jgi:hypothetical protein
MQFKLTVQTVDPISYDGFADVKYSTYLNDSLIPMAEKCGLYKIMWTPADKEYYAARYATPDLLRAIESLVSMRQLFDRSAGINSKANYDALLELSLNVLGQCLRHPDAEISVE